MMDRRPFSVMAAIALVVVLVGGCVTILPPVPGGQPTGAAPSGVDDIGGPGDLTPPILEEGDVPAYEETTPLTGHLTLGAQGDVASATVGSAGGTLETSGLRIDFEPDALAAEATFSVFATRIKAADFGGAVTPLTALYTVEGGDASLLSPVTVTLSATIPDGATAMAFWYDDAAGMLTPLVPISQDGASLTVGATHFSSIFGALIDLAKLPTTADSGFRPAIDDWQFTNYGSYVAPGGHCEGQSVTAIWYYVNQKRKAGAAPLFGLYDNNGQGTKTPRFQWDDSEGYRFVSSVQKDPIAVPFTYLFLRNAMWDSADGRLTYDAFRTAIALSGEPQLVRISVAGEGGHTMTVYRVTPDLLYVADPNYPGRRRTIPYDAATGKLGPYRSGANAADIAANGATVYTRIAYVPWQSSKSESGIAAHWAEFKAGAAGDSVFPRYTLEALVGDPISGPFDYVPLTDGYQSTQRRLQIVLGDPSSTSSVAMKIHQGTSSTPLGNWSEAQIVDLNDGINDLGIWVVFSSPGDPEWHYVDFVRLKVNLVAAASPSPTVAAAGQPVAVAVRMDIAGSFVRDTHLADLKIQATGLRTFGKHPSETRIKDLAGEIAADGKSVTLTIAYLDDPTAPALASCPNQTTLRNIPLISTDPATKAQTFGVSGWNAIIATIQDSYPYLDRTRTALCMTTADWSFNQDANPNPAIYVTLGY